MYILLIFHEYNEYQNEVIDQKIHDREDYLKIYAYNEYPDNECAIYKLDDTSRTYHNEPSTQIVVEFEEDDDEEGEIH